jgi:hypothetical protein
LTTFDGGFVAGFPLRTCKPDLKRILLAIFRRLYRRASLWFLHTEIVVQKIFVSTIDARINCTTINTDKEKPRRSLAGPRRGKTTSFRQSL